MREEYNEIHIVDNQLIRNTNYERKFPFTDNCAPSVLEMEREEEPIGVKDELSSFEEARVAFKKYCPPFEDGTIMTIIRFDAVMTEAVDSFKVPY